jgi:hypothetical protein
MPMFGGNYLFWMRTMARLLAAFLLLGLLPACAGVQDWPSFVRSTIRADKAVGVQYNFDWELSGHRAVAPVQVFDDGRKTWLQFSPQQPVPAIFVGSDGGGRPLAYAQDGPYVVLDGVWSVLVLRGGRLKSTIRRLNDRDGGQHAKNEAQQISGADARATASASATPVAVDGLETGHAVHSQGASAAIPVAAADAVAGNALRPSSAQAAAATELAAEPVATGRAATPAGVARATVQPESPKSSSLASTLTAASFDLSGSSPAERFQVSPQDINLRLALARWARQADWTFEPEHWTVDVDIPIMGAASFELDFKLAVRELAASTELADRPVQPCFYSNRVLRVVPYAQPCDRTAGSTRPS